MSYVGDPAPQTGYNNIYRRCDATQEAKMRKVVHSSLLHHSHIFFASHQHGPTVQYFAYIRTQYGEVHEWVGQYTVVSVNVTLFQ
jgi:hypothetical protein